MFIISFVWVKLRGTFPLKGNKPADCDNILISSTSTAKVPRKQMLKF